MKTDSAMIKTSLPLPKEIRVTKATNKQHQTTKTNWIIKYFLSVKGSACKKNADTTAL